MVAQIRYVLIVGIVLAAAVAAEPVVSGQIGKALDAYVASAMREGFSRPGPSDHNETACEASNTASPIVEFAVESYQLACHTAPCDSPAS